MNEKMKAAFDAWLAGRPDAVKTESAVLLAELAWVAAMRQAAEAVGTTLARGKLLNSEFGQGVRVGALSVADELYGLS